MVTYIFGSRLPVTCWWPVGWHILVRHVHHLVLELWYQHQRTCPYPTTGLAPAAWIWKYIIKYVQCISKKTTFISMDIMGQENFIFFEMKHFIWFINNPEVDCYVDNKLLFHSYRRHYFFHDSNSWRQKIKAREKGICSSQLSRLDVYSKLQLDMK